MRAPQDKPLQARRAAAGCRSGAHFSGSGGVFTSTAQEKLVLISGQFRVKVLDLYNKLDEIVLPKGNSS